MAGEVLARAKGGSTARLRQPERSDPSPLENRAEEAWMESGHESSTLS
jgi:hypothetical protein